MAYLALYRKYRPINFNDVCGQKEIVSVLRNAIMNDKLSHAYLFCGPRGTGKTTMAKIIARTINCTNLIEGNACGKCENCLNALNSSDIVEIDAASNNGVDEIRELKDKINLVPICLKYKIYIIDEVHMLTIQAFNALLKTLEEPPSHVIFILATTEPYKIPATILSRCQRFNFTKISDETICDRLKYICLKENIDIEDDALYEIARLSDGGMRDAINLLDQLHSYSNGCISISDIYKINGTVSYDELYDFMNYIKLNNKIEIIKFVDNIENEGKEIQRFLDEFIIFVKDIIIYKNVGILSNIEIKNDKIKQISDIYSLDILYSLINKLNSIQNQIKNSSHGLILFLVSILQYSNNLILDVDNNLSNIISREIILDKKNETCNCDCNKKENISQEIKDNLKNKNEQNISQEIKEIIINNALASGDKALLNNLKKQWNKIDDYVDSQEFCFEAGLLKDSLIVVTSNSYMVLTSDLISSVDRINNCRSEIEYFINKLFNLSVKIVCISTKEWNEYKIKYIDDIKKGIKYKVKPLECSKKSLTSVDELIDIIGENMIEYK